MTSDMMTGTRRGNRWSPLIWGVAVALIALPFVAMQVTREVDWSAGDFVFAAIMIGGTCAVIELTLRRASHPAYRGGVALALAAIFLLVWINGAVGIIGDEDNPRNLLYGCVIMTAVGGAVGAGFAARGMARAMALAAVAMASVCLMAMTGGNYAPPGPVAFVGIHAFFVALFGGSALLFRRAAINK